MSMLGPCAPSSSYLLCQFPTSIDGELRVVKRNFSTSFSLRPSHSQTRYCVSWVGVWMTSTKNEMSVGRGSFQEVRILAPAEILTGFRWLRCVFYHYTLAPIVESLTYYFLKYSQAMCYYISRKYKTICWQRHHN